MYWFEFFCLGMLFCFFDLLMLLQLRGDLAISATSASSPKISTSSAGCYRTAPPVIIVDAVGSSSSSLLGDFSTSKEWGKGVDSYSAVFQKLIVEGYLSPNSKALCIETPYGQDVFTLKDIGVHDAVGISKKSPPLVVFGQAVCQPFHDNTSNFKENGRLPYERGEFLVTNADRVELMAMLGLFGAIISACQISILERQELHSIHWSAGAVLPFVGFALAMFLFYSFVPTLLKHSGSTMLNLSLLSSDMWAVLIRIFAYHQKVDWIYFIAFAAVTAGLVVYSWGSGEEETNKGRVAEDTAEQSNTMDEEAATGNQAQGPIVGSSKPGDGKHDSTPSALQGVVASNKNIRRDERGNTS